MQVQDRRSYSEVERPSSYLDETDIRAGTDNQGHDFVVVNFEGKGRGHAERGHDIDIVVANSEGEGAWRAEQGHDIVVDMNVKGARGGRSVQGHDIVVGKHLEGGRRRAASDTSSSTSGSSRTTSVRDTLVKRGGGKDR